MFTLFHNRMAFSVVNQLPQIDDIDINRDIEIVKYVFLIDSFQSSNYSAYLGGFAFFSTEN